MSQVLVSRAPAGVAPRQTLNVNKKASLFMGAPVVGHRSNALVSQPTNKVQKVAGRGLSMKVNAVKDGTPLDRPLRVAVIGGGPSGACAAETLAQGGVEAFLIERKMDNCKVCALTIPHFPSSCILSFLSSLTSQR
jgi:heterodisulfide reductase subunit A-like polyferredoxin